jgi:hypothetical protein
VSTEPVAAVDSQGLGGLGRLKFRIALSATKLGVIRMILNDINKILPPLLFAFVFGIFAYVYFKSTVLLDIEKGLEPILNIRCTCFLDGMRHVFTRFTIYDDFIVVSSRKKIVLKYGEIKKVTRGRVLWGKSLDIWHTKTALPSISLILRDIDTPMRTIESKLDR